MIHVAGPYDRATGYQRCDRCGHVLKSPRFESVDAWDAQGHYAGQQMKPFPAARGYAVGALIEQTRYGCCYDLKATAPTCVAAAMQEVA